MINNGAFSADQDVYLRCGYRICKGSQKGYVLVRACVWAVRKCSEHSRLLTQIQAATRIKPKEYRKGFLGYHQ